MLEQRKTKGICKYCGKKCGNNGGLKMHEIWCPNNPDKEQANKIKNKMSDNRADFSGKNHPRYGEKWSEEWKKKLSKQMIGKNNPNFRNYGENTFNWNNWTYQRIHRVIKQLKIPLESCEICRKKTQKLECSYNLPHFKRNPLYYSLNPSHYTWRCNHCHQIHDNNAFWVKWNEEKIEEYTKNLKILKKNWPHKIEKNILKKLNNK